MGDLYQILGVSTNATQAEIKSAYRRLARQYHPDVSSSRDGNAKFVEIGEAYQILGDPNLRAMHDRGEPIKTRKTYYSTREAEVIAYQREFDRFVDEVMAQERKEAAARSHAVSIVVTLFLSSFYVAFAKPAIIEELNLPGKIIVFLAAIYGLWYLFQNLSMILKRYTYTRPPLIDPAIHADDAEDDKIISRAAGLIFIVSGYLDSIGLGYLLSMITHLYYTKTIGSNTILGIFLYPPIAALIIGSIRRIGAILDRSI